MIVFGKSLESVKRLYCVIFNKVDFIYLIVIKILDGVFYGVREFGKGKGKIMYYIFVFFLKKCIVCF